MSIQPPFRRRLVTAMRLRCPACTRGKPFETLLKTRHHCGVCGYRFEREEGYFLGSLYFNYGATVGVLIGGYFLLEALFGLTFLQQTFIWLGFCLVFPLWFLRFARSIWMAVDLSVSPPAESDFVLRTPDEPSAADADQLERP